MKTRAIKNVSLGLAFSLFLGALHADAKSNISDLIKLRTNQDFLVKDIYNLSQKGTKIAILHNKNENNLVPVVIDENGNTIFLLTNVFFAKNDDDSKLIARVLSDVQGVNANSKDAKKLDEILAKIPDDYKITFKSTESNPTKKTTYIFSDPTCPHCQDELKNIDSRLKEGDVTMVLVSFLGEGSKLKAGYILDNINGKNSNDAKIKLFKEAYKKSFRPKNVQDASRDKVNSVTKDILDAGVFRSVPFIYQSLN